MKGHTFISTKPSLFCFVCAFNLDNLQYCVFFMQYCWFLDLNFPFVIAKLPASLVYN